MPVVKPTPSNALGRLMVSAWRNDGLTHALAVAVIQGPMEPMGYVKPAMLRQVIRQRRAERVRLAKKASVLLSRLSGLGFLQGASGSLYELDDLSAEYVYRHRSGCRARLVQALARGPMSRDDLLWAAGGNPAPRPADWRPSGYLGRLLGELEEDGTVSRSRKLTELGEKTVQPWVEALPVSQNVVYLWRAA